MIEYERVAREKAMIQPVPNGAPLEFDVLGERDILVHLYSWAIPNEEALAAIARHGPILEIGAGNGYWAKLLTERGVDVLAFDPVPFAKGQYAEIRGRRVERRKWGDVREGDHTVVSQHPDRTLFMCWPQQDTWATEALLAYQGETVIYVGEWGGCTADEAFHTHLLMGWEKVEEIAIPQFWPVHDELSIWKRSG